MPLIRDELGLPRVVLCVFTPSSGSFVISNRQSRPSSSCKQFSLTTSKIRWVSCSVIQYSTLFLTQKYLENLSLNHM